MRKFILFVVLGSIIYVLLSVCLSFLKLKQELIQIVLTLSVGLIQGYIGYIIYGKKSN